VNPFQLDLVIPTYLAVSDLTQRVARDAGLGAYWEDGTRRTFFLRARGRVLRDEEKLDELGIVPHELLHLLPQPPDGSDVYEQPPEYPPNKGYTGAGNLNVAASLAVNVAWAVGWSVALTVSLGPSQTIFPAIALALLCVSFSRHLFGGAGSAIKIPALGAAVYLALCIMAFIPTVAFGGHGALAVAMGFFPALISGLFGVMLGWLAWYGAVEPLPKVTAKQVEAAVAAQVFQCGICGGEVTQDQRADCIFACGRVFHQGCYKAKQSLGAGDGCAVCGYKPA
jgi:hypothetical protein